MREGRAMYDYRFKVAAYDATAIMSSSDMALAIAIIGALAGVARAPDLKPTSCRTMYPGDTPASGGIAPTPCNAGP